MAGRGGGGQFDGGAKRGGPFCKSRAEFSERKPTSATKIPEEPNIATKRNSVYRRVDGNAMSLKQIVALHMSVVVCFLFVPVASGQSDPDEPRVAVKFLAESYSEHRESFPKLKVRFQWAEVKAGSRDQALDGEFIHMDEPIDCLLITAPRRRRYEYICGKVTQAEVREQMAQSQAELLSVKCLSYFLLEADGYALRYSPVGKMANLFVPGGAESSGVQISPFDLGTMGPDGVSHPARYLNEALNGRFQFDYIGQRYPDQSDLTVATIGDRLRDEFSFDPDRAFLLSRYSCFDHQNSLRLSEMRVLDAVECSANRWFPMRAVKIRFPDDSERMRIFYLKVLEFDPDYDASPADWELELSDNTNISVANEVQWTRTPDDKSERFAASDFPTLHDRCIERGRQYEEEVRREESITNIESPRRRSITWTIITVNGVVVLSFLIWLWRKRSKH